MDWSAVGQLVGQAAPTLGGLLGGLIPFPGGAILGEVAGKVIAASLGVPPTPEAVGRALQNKSSDEVAAALSEAEARINAEVEKFKAQLADVQDARETNFKLADIGSSLQWGAPVVSVLITLGFIATLLLLLTTHVNFNEVTGQALLLLIGSLSTMQVSVVTYWLGSSAGSADKSAQIALLASNAAKPPPKPIKK